MADETENGPAAQDASGPGIRAEEPPPAESHLDLTADEPEQSDWSPPQTDARGFAIDGDGLPLNLRLRASVLADQGASEDPAGSVSTEAIEGARHRLAEYDRIHPPIPASAKKAELEAIASESGVDISAAANNEERAALILGARPPRIY